MAGLMTTTRPAADTASFDLAGQSLRELNQFLHRGLAGGTVTRVEVLNPDGAHNIAVGVDAPVEIEVHGHAGYYCAGMNKQSRVLVHGNVGPGVAEGMVSGTVHVKDWAAMDDEAIIAELVAIRGIGRWTAEMFLIFYLTRPNVLPLDDVGLINGISQNYFSGESVSRSDAREVAAAWAPFCSVATWYIWRSLDPLPVLGAEKP